MTEVATTGTTGVVMKEIKDLNVIATMETITGIVATTMVMIVTITETKIRKKIAMTNSLTEIKKL